MSAFQISKTSDYIVIASSRPDEVVISAHDSTDDAPLWLSMPLHVALAMAAEIAAKVIEVQNEKNKEEKA